MNWPPNQKPRNLAAFTLHRDGWVRWYQGKTRFVCGKTLDVGEVEEAWHNLKKSIDSDKPRPVPVNWITLKDAASHFLIRQERRVDGGSAYKPLRPHTFHDYTRIMELLRDEFGANRELTTLGPSDFEKILHRLKDRAPSTVARTIAYVRAFFTYAKDVGLIPATPNYGPDFVKPHAQAHRDKRLAAKKAYQPNEIRALWDAATDEEKCWIGLGLNAAFDNSDVATLTLDAIDLKKGVIDFQRRKVGKVRRVCPIQPEVLKLLRAYQRPQPKSPEYADLFFLSGDGYPLVRVQNSKKDPARMVQIDALSMRWKRLLSRAGVRPPIKAYQKDGKRWEEYPKGDGRGFRSLRTAFSNLAPFGYREEVEIIMGHAHGSVLLDNYLETVGMKRLRQLVRVVWKAAFTMKKQAGAGRKKKNASAESQPGAEPTPNPSR